MILTLKKPELESFINEQIRLGNFPTAEAVIEGALERMMEEEPVKLTEDDIAAIKESDEQIARGEVIDFDKFAAEMRQKYRLA